MEENQKKCSNKKHAEIDAISYCQECKKYFCNKCQNQHADLLEDHKTINLKDVNEAFIEICKEVNHSDKLEFYCKEHNELCCAACTAKFKEEGYGQHHTCDVCPIKKIKEEKKNKLKENINLLEQLNAQMDKSFEEIKKISEEIIKNKEELKKRVQNIFTRLRSALNEKEDKLLQEIDEQYDNKYFKEDLIKECEKLPMKIKKSIEKGKIIEKEWNDNNLPSLINDCINIENNITEINKLNESINKSKLNKESKIEYNIDEYDINNMIEKIKNFGKIMTDDNLYDDYKIENKNPIHKLTNHTNIVLCLCVMKDGRLVSGAGDNSIIIYNKITYQPDLIIKEHNG